MLKRRRIEANLEWHKKAHATKIVKLTNKQTEQYQFMAQKLGWNGTTKTKIKKKNCTRIKATISTGKPIIAESLPKPSTRLTHRHLMDAKQQIKQRLLQLMQDLALQSYSSSPSKQAVAEINHPLVS